MGKTIIFLMVLLMIVSCLPASVLADSDADEKEEVIGLFGSLLAPSIFTTARCESLQASIFGRVITGEGQVPDFSGGVKDNIDSLQLYINGRLGGFGATIGFGQGNEFEFSQPLILSVDYKIEFLDMIPIFDAAIDVQYSMIYLPDKKTIKVSTPGFGVASLNGLFSTYLLFLEPYAGLTLNYVYLDSKDKLYTVWKPVPKVGLMIKPIPFVCIGSEVSLIMNETLNDSWAWNFGVRVRF